jgi:transketolase
MADFDKLKKLCQLIRYDILTSTTEAKSGHPTTSLSAVELMTTLFFSGFYHFDLKNPNNLANDRVIFSKGHATPLLYSLYQAAGVIPYQELMQLRKIKSNLEGHPTFRFKYADVATGSLGQGLSIGVGMALGMKLQKSPAKVFVLLGDSEMAEGQVWEAIQIASHYKLNNLIAIADINRLGQSTQTMLGWDLKTYAKRLEAFGWKTIIVDDGHNLKKVYDAFKKATNSTNLTGSTNSTKPIMIIAKTIKGKGVSFLENKESWHGKPVPKDMLESALKELGKINFKVRASIKVPNLKFKIKNLKLNRNLKFQISNYQLGDLVATRKAYGQALSAIGNSNEKVVVLDAEVSNSTYSEKFAKKFPNKYFEMFIAEQNMISTALGLSKLGLIPFASTFAAFLTRGFDQIRMAQYSAPNLKICGSHSGVSIGSDGPSQMGLEDISMFRSILKSTIFYPADAVSTFKLTQIMANKNGLFYLRTTRMKTPVIYDEKEEFKVGGSKLHLPAGRQGKASKVNKEKVLIIGAGVTLHEALKAQKELAKQGIGTVVLDCYSVKPLDIQTISQLVSQIPNIVVVEDHYPTGGIGEAVADLIVNYPPAGGLKIKNFIHLSVNKIPRSGSPEELLRFEEIDAQAIIKAVKKLLK